MEFEGTPFRQQSTCRTIWGSASFCVLIGHIGHTRHACSFASKRTRGRGYLRCIQYLDADLTQAPESHRGCHTLNVVTLPSGVSS